MRTFGENFLAPFRHQLVKLFRLAHAVNEPHVERLLRGVLAAAEYELAGLAFANVTGQQLARAPDGNAAYARTRLSEFCRIRGERHVAKQMDLVSAPHAKPADLCDDRFVHHAHDRGQCEEAPHVSAADVRAARGLVADIAAGAERLVTRARKHDYADRGIVSRPVHPIRQFFVRLGADRVAFLGPVDGHRGNAVSRHIKNVFVIQDASPFCAPSGAGGRRDGVMFGRCQCNAFAHPVQLKRYRFR